MRIVRFDEGFFLDDPNIFFGATDDEPAYQLEPGDPGYINTTPATGTTTGKKKGTSMNETPRILRILLALAKEIMAGATQLQAVIGMHHHTDATLETAILKLEGDPDAAPNSNANHGSQLVYKMAGNTTKDARAALDALSNGEVKKLLTFYRKTMEGVHGSKHNVGWQSAGFLDNMAVPRDHVERGTLLGTMRSYLAAHPGHEASYPQPEGPPLAVTAAAAQALGVTFQSAITLVNTCEGAEALCKNLRDADKDALFKEVSGCIAELHRLLPADDPRWETFGLNIPANPNPPEAVTSLTLTASGTGREELKWDRARRATYYRIFIKVAGVDEDFRYYDRDEDLEYMIRDLTPGSTISVYVVAANAGGDAAPSPTVTKVVGA